jgi:hypothetical protein
MKRSGTFKWTPKAAAAFEDLKRYLMSPPILVAHALASLFFST